MKELRRLLFASGMAANLIAACGNSSGGDDNEIRSGRPRICRSICERVEECGAEGLNECVRACRNDSVSSSAALQVVEICTNDVRCLDFDNGNLAECVAEGIVNLDMSAAADEYCEALGDSSDCLGEALLSIKCNAASSAYLAELSECLDDDCDSTGACADAVASRYDVRDSLIQLASTDFGGGGPACCSAVDPCDWASDDTCDCGGAFAWDASDCDL